MSNFMIPKCKKSLLAIIFQLLFHLFIFAVAIVTEHSSDVLHKSA